MTIWEAEEGAIYAGSGSTAGGQTSETTDSEDLSLEILELLCDLGLGRSEMAGEVRVFMVGGRREGIPLSPCGRCLRLAGWSQCMSCMQVFYAGRPGWTDGGMSWPRVVVVGRWEGPRRGRREQNGGSGVKPLRGRALDESLAASLEDPEAKKGEAIQSKLQLR